MLLGMAPVVTVVAETSLGLVPILGLPTAAVYLACRGAIRADRERARAEAAAEQARATAAEQARLVEGEQALIRQLQESDRLKRDLLATQGGELLLTDPPPPGQGARFELRLPLAELDQPQFLAYAASRR
jgi:hypothetical protein